MKRRHAMVGLGVVCLLLVAPGFIRGATRANRQGATLTSGNQVLGCSQAAYGKATYETEISFDADASPVHATRTVAVRVPTNWWEVDALRSPTSSRDRRARARACVFGDPFRTLPLTFSSGSGYTRVVEHDDGYRVGDRPCVGTLYATLEYRVVRLRHGMSEHCGNADGTLPSSSSTAFVERVVARHARLRVHPAPAREETGVLEWKWTGAGAAPRTDMQVRISFDSYVSTRVAASGEWTLAQIGSFEIRSWPGAAASWSATGIALLAVLIALGLAGGARGRGVVAVVAALLVLLVAVLVHVHSERMPFEAAIALVPVAALGAATAILIGRRIATAVVVAASAGAVIALGLLDDGPPRFHDDRLAPMALAITVVALLFLVVTLIVLWRHMVGVLPQSGTLVPWPLVRATVATLMAAAFGYAVAWGIGYAWQHHRFAELLTYVVTDGLYQLLAYALPVTAAVAFAAILATWTDDSTPRALVVAVGLVWGLVAPPGDFVLWGIRIPLAMFVLAALVAVVVHRRRLVPLQGDVDASALSDPATAASLFAHGPKPDLRGNVRVAVERGAVLAVLPLAYFAWGALDSLPARTAFSPGGAFLVDALVLEAARWLATAALFGLLYARLPGPIGPVKGVSLAAAWFAAAAAVEIAGRWAGHDTGRVWTFPALQLLLFLAVLGLWFDWDTMKAAGGTWADLQLAYRIERTRDLVKYGVPVLLAVLAISQQVLSGTGFDFVRSVVESVPHVTNLGGG